MEATRQNIDLCCGDSDVLEANQLDDTLAQRTAEMFRVLGDPTRLRVIALLRESEVCVHTLASTLDMSQSAISHQLRVLRQMGLVRSRKQGRFVYYTLDDNHVRDMVDLALLHAGHE